MNVSQFEHSVAAALPGDGARVLAAVSGGADSVALLRALHRLQAEGRFELHAAHFNHGLRGAASDADARWVADVCRQLGVPITLDGVDEDTPGRMGSIEEEARHRRYAFLIETARHTGAPFVATAHTADDQVETVLHHVVRGTGLAGLGGMPAARGLAWRDGNPQTTLIRPLLRLRRADVEAYLQALGQDYRQDATNADEQFTRNRIRHTLLPLLREQFNPRVDEALLKLSQQARQAADALDSVAAALLAAAALQIAPEICRLDRAALREAHPHLVRCALVLLWDRAGWPRQMMAFDDWQRTAALASEEGALTLPGNIDARTRGNALVLRRRG